MPYSETDKHFVIYDQDKKTCALDEPYTLSILLVYEGQETGADLDSLISQVNRLFEITYGGESQIDAGIEIQDKHNSWPSILWPSILLT